MINQRILDYLTPAIFVVTSKSSEYNYMAEIIKENTPQSTEIEWLKSVDDLLNILELRYPQITIIFSDTLPTDVRNALSGLQDILPLTSCLSVIEIGSSNNFSECANYLALDIIYDMEEDEETAKKRTVAEELARFQENASKPVDKDGRALTEPEYTVEEQNERIEETKDHMLDVPKEIVALPVDAIRETFSPPPTSSDTTDPLLAINMQLLDELEGYAKIIEDKNIEYSRLEHHLLQAKNQINALREELKENDERFGEKEQELKTLTKQLMAKEKALNDRETSINRINDKFSDATSKNTEELKISRDLTETLNKELHNLRKELSTLKVENGSKLELLKEQRNEIKKLKEELSDYRRKITDITKEMSDLQTSHVGADSLEKLQHELEDSTVIITNLENQISTLKVDLGKIRQQKEFLEEDYKQLETEYTQFIDEGVLAKADSYGKHTLQGSGLPLIMYFKVVTQPTYFKSFIQTLQRELSHIGSTLVIFIREEDYIYDAYYNGVSRYNHFDEISPTESYALISPNRFMTSPHTEWYTQFDNIVIVDYTRTEQVFIESQTLLLYHTYLTENERAKSPYKGIGSLYAGEKSIVDMSYDRRYESVKNPFMKNKLITLKVKDWLSTIL